MRRVRVCTLTRRYSDTPCCGAVGWGRQGRRPKKGLPVTSHGRPGRRGLRGRRRAIACGPPFRRKEARLSLLPISALAALILSRHGQAHRPRQSVSLSTSSAPENEGLQRSGSQRVARRPVWEQACPPGSPYTPNPIIPPPYSVACPHLFSSYLYRPPTPSRRLRAVTPLSSSLERRHSTTQSTVGGASRAARRSKQHGTEGTPPRPAMGPS